MALAPIAVFASMAAIVTTQGLGILVTYRKFVLEFYFGLVARSRGEWIPSVGHPRHQSIRLRDLFTPRRTEKVESARRPRTAFPTTGTTGS
jgi:hypothetical protein